MNEYIRQMFKGERPLFGQSDLHLVECIFDAGESPLKECSNLDIEGSMFRWKYPLWYTKNVKVNDTTWFDMARAGVWYTKNVTVSNSLVQAPKNFRRCQDLTLSDVVFTNAAETLWHCDNVNLKNVTARGDYFAMDCSNMVIDNLILDGNYSFDGVKNMTITNSKLISKDAFWNSENITAKNCFITGEYLGWNAKNLTLIDCTIESLQGLCYIDNLVMKNCHLFNTDLAFEYSSVDAEITGDIVSVLNPKAGTIKAEHIGELILEKDQIDPSATKIICSSINKHSDKVCYEN